MDRHDAWVNLDRYKRSAFLRNELKRTLLRSVKRSTVVPYTRRYFAAFQLTNLPKISSSNFSVNRCIVSGRVWSVNKKTRYGRFILRKEISYSNLPGCSRASW